MRKRQAKKRKKFGKRVCCNKREVVDRVAYCTERDRYCLGKLCPDYYGV